MNKGYITIHFKSNNDLTELLKNTKDLFTGILEYIEGVEVQVMAGKIDPQTFVDSGIVSQFWIDFLNDKPLSPAFAEKDKDAENQDN